MRFIDRRPPYELTFADVFLLPQDYLGGSRKQVDLTAPDPVGLPLPIIAADMPAVCTPQLATALARRGGLGLFPSDLPANDVAEGVRQVKEASPYHDTPAALTADATVGQARSALAHLPDGLVVIDNGRDYGLLSKRELATVEDFVRLGEVAAATPVKVAADAAPEDVFARLVTEGVDAAVVFDGDQLVGVTSRSSAVRAELYRPALDADGRLMIGAAVGIGEGAGKRAEALVDCGVDVIVVHTPHAAQEQARATVRGIRAAIGDTPLVAGVVVTAASTRAIVDAGADVVRIGHGAGAMCTTRMATGVGRPQFSAVLECASAARERGAAVWSDGGIRYPRDVALALTAGASAVIIGSWFVRTVESAPELQHDEQGRPYKDGYGLASQRAVHTRFRHLTEFRQALNAVFDEGLSHSRLYLDPQRPGVEDLLDQITAGVRSACAYSGVTSITQLHEHAIVGVQSPAGFTEGMPMPTGW
ncbi:GuaB1 family IMP dehydrogenase-related protein [Amycolatopsis sp. cmx-11-12]|uniref:GuaB1 family IMP dehydrogenase-related protein n=1 Tax=Amycolatopsis sp. cmx-11-12 TaxID=2785795 RepID=UPI0039183BC4